MKKAILVLFVGLCVLFGIAMKGIAKSPAQASFVAHEEELIGITDSSQQWIANFGGTSFEEFTAIAETNDGGFIVAGTTYSFGAGGADIWVLKFNSDASIAWQKTYGGTADDRSMFIGQTDTGQYFVVAETYSFRTDGYWDTWILKLGANGDILWQKTCCPTSAHPDAAHITDNGELVMGGYSTLNGSSFLLRLQANGTIVWQKSGIIGISDIQEISDGEFLISAGNVMLLDANGNLIWTKAFRGVGLYSGLGVSSAKQTSDGGFIVSGLHYEEGVGDFLGVVRLTSDGTVIWQKDLDILDGGVLEIFQSSDGGFIALQGDKLLKLDANGNLLWKKAFEGFALTRMAKAPDGGMVLVGRYDTSATILKTDPDGNILPCGFILESTSIITDSQLIATTPPITITTTNLALADTISTPEDTGVNPNYICEGGRQIPKLIQTIFTASGRSNVVLVSQVDPSSNNPILPQYTLDSGNSWQPITEHALSHYLIGITPRDDLQVPVRLLSAYPTLSGHSLYRSGDWGQTWASGFLDSNDYAFAISPKNSQKMYWSLEWSTPCFPGCEGGSQLNIELYQSSDGGINWTPMYTSTGYAYIEKIYPSPVNEADGFFAIRHIVFGEGLSWVRFGSIDQLTFPIDLIALDATDANLIYGVTSTFSSGQTSPDGGITWNPWASSPPLACVQLMAHPTKTNTLYLRCAAGLFRSTNGGDNWTQITTTQGDALAPHLGNPGQILWSHDGCLLTSDTDGDSWTILKCFNSFPYHIFLPMMGR